RFYDVGEDESSPSLKKKLVERAVLTNDVDLKSRGKNVTGKVRTETNTDRGSGPVHPMGAQRERHRVELERRFGLEIAQLAGKMTKSWTKGVVVFIAEPRFLGITRESMRQALDKRIELKEIARDYAHITVTDLYDHLARNGIVPALQP